MKHCVVVWLVMALARSAAAQSPAVGAAAEVASRIVERSEPAELVDHRAERTVRESAELTYKRQEIHLGLGHESHASQQGWIAYQGEGDQALDSLDFYAKIGRPDLVDRYNYRRHIAIGSGIASALGAIAAIGLTIADAKTAPSCPPASFQQCDEHAAQYAIPIYASVGVAALGAVIAVRYWRNPQPITEGEARQLVDAYNQGLRVRLGLPVASRPLLRDVKVAPYVSASQGGLALSARF